MGETKLDSKALADDWARALWSRDIEKEGVADVLAPLIAKLIVRARAAGPPTVHEREALQRVDERTVHLAINSLRKTVALNRGQSADVLAAGVLAWCDAVSTR